MSEQRHSWSSDRDLERADELLDQADAFLRRHRSGFADAPRTGAATESAAAVDAADPSPFDDEDLPILTDVVDEFDSPSPAASADEPPPPSPAAVTRPPPAAGTEAAPARPATVIDRLADARNRQLAPQNRPLADEAHAADGSIDSAVARAVENWLADELPLILTRELAQLSFRVNKEVSTGLRAAIRQALASRPAAPAPGATPEEPD